jgi:cold shock CspA family protein
MSDSSTSPVNDESKMQNSREQVIVSESRLVGRVKWFNQKSGFGFITLCEDNSEVSESNDNDNKEKDIFVHYSCLSAENSPYKYLVPGEYVEFDLVKTEDDKHEYHAANVSGIKGGPLMYQTHSLNNITVRNYVPRPRRAYDDSNANSQSERRPHSHRDSTTNDSDLERNSTNTWAAVVGGEGGVPTYSDGFVEVKRRRQTKDAPGMMQEGRRTGGPRKRPAPR